MNSEELLARTVQIFNPRSFISSFTDSHIPPAHSSCTQGTFGQILSFNRGDDFRLLRHPLLISIIGSVSLQLYRVLIQSFANYKLSFLILPPPTQTGDEWVYSHCCRSPCIFDRCYSKRIIRQSRLGEGEGFGDVPKCTTVLRWMPSARKGRPTGDVYWLRKINRQRFPY